MKLSIITINFNNHEGLKKTIPTVLSQSFKNFEYIIIDGNSTDGSKEFLEQNDESIDYWLSEPDNGIYDAMNKGIQVAKGQYCLFLNSGDCFNDATVLEKYQSCCNDKPNHDIYYGNIWIDNGDDKAKTQNIFPERLNLTFFRNATINHQASFIKRELFNEFGLYPQTYKLAADYWLFLISLLRNKSFIHLDFHMVIYDTSGVSSIDFDPYRKEMDHIWKALVPEFLDHLLLENSNLKKLLKFNLVKNAVYLNNYFQKIKHFK